MPNCDILKRFDMFKAKVSLMVSDKYSKDGTESRRSKDFKSWPTLILTVITVMISMTLLVF